MTAVSIGGRFVGPNHPCFIVAEIGINHNGDLGIAKRLIDVAVDAGCDAVKFQKRDIELCYTPEELAKVRPGPSPWGDDITNEVQKRKLEFGQAEYDEIDRYCREKGIMWFASPWDEPSVDFLERYNPPCYKVASPRMRDEPLLAYLLSTGRPLIMSTGACEMPDIERAVAFVKHADLILAHCVLTYPADPGSLNLRMIKTLQQRFPDVPVGYSGHEKGLPPSVMAAVLGACLIERHITLDWTMYGSDQAASMEPAGIKTLVRDIRLWEQERGDGVKRMLPGEEKNLEKLRRKTLAR